MNQEEELKANDEVWSKSELGGTWIGEIRNEERGRGIVKYAEEQNM